MHVAVVVVVVEAGDAAGVGTSKGLVEGVYHGILLLQSPQLGLQTSRTLELEIPGTNGGLGVAAAGAEAIHVPTWGAQGLWAGFQGCVKWIMSASQPSNWSSFCMLATSRSSLISVGQT
uniref:Uncharacterized protein n=1 Tax=Eutreptiella gymnastica TaxID=73025 RepID=A0A7S1JF11_9EUGL|mmetsp:Transcript_91197/g.158098  ORF Transcript_91197/g.158098 Transcript_91197/m.158098 type:complete len:119 (+) Transcript_91197:66-422(+)